MFVFSFSFLNFNRTILSQSNFVVFVTLFCLRILYTWDRATVLACFFDVFVVVFDCCCWLFLSSSSTDLNNRDEFFSLIYIYDILTIIFDSLIFSLFCFIVFEKFWIQIYSCWSTWDSTSLNTTFIALFIQILICKRNKGKKNHKN